MRVYAQLLLCVRARLRAVVWDQLTVPTSFGFLQRLLLVADAPAHVANLAAFYCERMLQEYGMLKHLPSTVAAAAVSLALRACGLPAWVRVRVRGAA
jgi:hypothetical protein